MELSLLAELKRRRVFRALVGYGIAAFAVLQIIEPLMHGLHWPDEVLSYVVAALAVGFPIVVSLAWIFDIGASGIQRTPPTGATWRGKRLAAVLVGIGVLAAAPGTFWYFVVRRIGSPPAPTAQLTPSIAVLPFVNLSSDKENEYFSDGVSEEIINALANVEGLRVVARTSAFAYKGKDVNVRRVGEELGVGSVLEGSVRRDGKGVRVAAQLIDAVTGYHLWSKTYDRDVENLFSTENELAGAIVKALMPKLVHAPALVRESTPSAEAHDLYLKGRYFWNQRTADGLAKGIGLFQRAVALDPGYALAHSGLADSYDLLIDYGRSLAAEVVPRAREHALKAVQLDPSLAEGHTSLANIESREHRWTNAEQEFRRAIQLSPGYATAHHWYALFLMQMGRLSEAQREVERARQLDPTSMIINTAATQVLYDSRAYDAAADRARKTLELYPAWVPARMLLARAHVQAGRMAEALAALDSAPAPSETLLAERARVVEASGDSATARRVLGDLEKRGDLGDLRFGNLAAAHAALGDIDAALTWLKRAVAAEEQTINTLKTSPDWDALRPDPRFVRILGELHLQ
jgi:serine/threonine-protein kinase